MSNRSTRTSSHLPIKLPAKRRNRTAVLSAWLLCILFVAVRYYKFRTGAQPIAALKQAEIIYISRNAGRVRVWEPHTTGCTGTFVMKLPGADSSRAPLLMLREAAVDYRHNSLREMDINNGVSRGARNLRQMRRVALQVTTGNDFKGSTRPKRLRPVLPPHASDSSKSKTHTDQRTHNAVPTAILTGSSDAWTASVDYVITPALCATVCFYTDGARTICAGDEWQVVVTLVAPAFIETESQLEQELGILESKQASLNISLPFTYSGSGTGEGDDERQHLQFDAELALGCISGLTASTSVDRLLPTEASTRKKSCLRSTGAVVVSGAAVFGRKRTSKEGHHEIAHYAARALLGSVRFDTIAVAIQTVHPVAEIDSNCGLAGTENGDCRAQYHANNTKLLTDIAANVEQELKHIGVPESDWSRLVLFPFCRLGSDFDGGEQGDPCAWSAYNGQLVLNNHAYTVFSPFHKWHASVDLDEFIVNDGAYMSSSPPNNRVPALGRQVKPRRAAELFDERAARTRRTRRGVVGALRFAWLDFRLFRQDWETMVRDIWRNGGLEMQRSPAPVMDPVARASATLNRTACYGSRQIEGKSAVSCEAGIGVSNHDVLLLPDTPEDSGAGDLRKRVCNDRTASNFDELLVTYHPRVPTPRNGACAYLARPETPDGG
jgi:hypothetical protein